MSYEFPIPNSFLRGILSDGYVTIVAPSTKVIMLIRDAHALMHWLFDVLPQTPVEPVREIRRGQTEHQKDVHRRMASYSDLWIRRRAAA